MANPPQNQMTTSQQASAPVPHVPMRMKLPAVVAEQFGIDAVYWKALTEVVFPSAESPDAIVMALAYCKARNLDVMKKVVHVVPIWNQKAGKTVEGIWPGISELRTTAMRTNNYAGRQPTVFGPDVKAKVGNVEVTYPEWAQVTVLRLLAGKVYEFAGPQVYWMEAYSSKGKDPSPNAMWSKRPRGQLDKCAEAAALRAAFPEEIGGEIAAEEVQYAAFAEREVPVTRTVELTHRPQDVIDKEPDTEPKSTLVDNEASDTKSNAPDVSQVDLDDDLPPHIRDAPPIEGEVIDPPTPDNADDDDFPGDRPSSTQDAPQHRLTSWAISQLAAVKTWTEASQLLAKLWAHEEYADFVASGGEKDVYNILTVMPVWKEADQTSPAYRRVTKA